MKLSVRVINWFLRRVFETLCRVDARELNKLPTNGPLILVGNHVNFLDVPVLLPHMDNRPVTGLAKIETWDNPLFYFLFNQWEIIPINREMVDRDAIRLSIEALNNGKILAVMPEGTRSRDGRLRKGKPGIVILALRGNAPLIPVGFYGHENFWHNIKHLRRTDFHVVVGEPFHLNTDEKSLTRDARQEITDEIMYKIAELLPEHYRGSYQDVGQTPYKYLIAV